jgi:large subunit ribosomal protein L10
MAVDAAEGTAPVAHKRATVRPDKAEAVAELATAFRTATAAVLTEYRGLSVKQVTALRVALGADTTYSVVKNTLTKLAAVDAGLDGLDAMLSGPTAVAFVNGEPVEAAKALRDYARTNPQLVVKGGVLDGKPLTADEIRRLADLESREVLLAKMAGALKASLTNAVYLFNAPLQQTARLAAALQAKAEEDPSIIGGAGTPAVDSTPVDSAPVDSAPVDSTAVDSTAVDSSPAGVDGLGPEAVTEVGASESGSTEAGTAEAGTAEISTPEISTSEISTAETSTPETA